jgi:hypothetical protein
MNKTRMGSAVTAHAMPTPSMNCQLVAAGPIQPVCMAMPRPTIAPSNSGALKSASPAVMRLSRRLAQAFLQVELDAGNPDKDHHGPPRNAGQGLDDRGIEHMGVLVREDISRGFPGPSRIPVMICTTTSGA